MLVQHKTIFQYVFSLYTQHKAVYILLQWCYDIEIFPNIYTLRVSAIYNTFIKKFELVG